MLFQELPKFHAEIGKFRSNFHKIANFLRILWISGNYLGFPAIPEKIRENLGEKLSILSNFSKFLQNNAKISKFLKIQLDNLVDLEKREKMSLLSHSEASIQPRYGNFKSRGR